MKQINQTMLKLITIFCMNHQDSSSHFPFIDDFLIRKGKTWENVEENLGLELSEISIISSTMRSSCSSKARLWNTNPQWGIVSRQSSFWYWPINSNTRDRLSWSHARRTWSDRKSLRMLGRRTERVLGDRIIACWWIQYSLTCLCGNIKPALCEL